MENYTFDEFEEILNNGYQVYFTYLKNRYLLFKSAENCYTQKLMLVRAKKSTTKATNGNKEVYNGDISIYGRNRIQV